MDLSAVRDADAVPAIVAHALGATYTGRRQVPVEETLKHALRDRQVLLVLDNFEGVLEAAPLVERLLAACPRLRAIVTSREPLHTQSEQQFEVMPLATPDLSALPSLQTLRQTDAVALFAARVQPLRPGWDVTAANAGAVAEICVRLDGLPLAIELAESWMNVLSPQAMLPELPHTMQLLGRRGADQSLRHQTLEATIGWSHELLSEPERQLFRRLAVFENGWTVDSCRAVCADAGAERAETLKLLGSLVDKHLVVRNEDDEGSVRFGLLETIRVFAFQRLAQSGDLAVTLRRHAECVLALAERAEAELDSPAQATWIECLEQERGNIRAALEWARTSGEPGAVELGLRLAATLWLFWDLRGHMLEGREPVRARALLAAGWLGYVKGDVGEVERLVTESLSIARECSDARGVGRALAVLGTTLAAYGDQSDRTTAVLDEALRVSRPLGDTWSTGFALYNLGVQAMKAGRLDQASNYLEQCRDVSAASGNTFGVGCSVFRLGWVAGARDERARAVELLKEALRLHWALRNRRVVALCLEQLACLGSGRGGARDQVRLFGVAETMFEQLPDYTLPPQMVEAHRHGAEAARETLGGGAFAEAWTAGRNMSVEQAVALAPGPHQVAPNGLERLGLTARVQILRLVADGLTNRQIGLRLGLSHHTVDNHLRRIFAKVGVSSRTGLAMWSVRSGVVSTNG